MDKKLNIASVPKDKLVFANRDANIKDQKFDDKPIGYFKDAWLRFCKNKASIVAACIIICIVLFAVIVPFFNGSGNGTYATTRYAKKVPRNLLLTNVGIATGDVKREYNERTLINFAALGIGASSDFMNKTTVGDAINSDDPLQPITKIKKVKETSQGKNTNSIYTVKVDNYLETGFAYMDVEQSEYRAMLEWQAQTGIQLIYPMIELNEYNFAVSAGLSENANWWYKTDAKGAPVKIVKDAITGENKTVTIKYDSLDELTLVEAVGSLFDNVQFTNFDVANADNKVVINGFNVICATLDAVKSDTMRELSDKFRDSDPLSITVLATSDGVKGNICVGCGKEAVSKGAHAGNIARTAAMAAGGSGGGKPDSAMAGAKDVNALPEAVKKAEELLVGMLK